MNPLSFIRLFVLAAIVQLLPPMPGVAQADEIPITDTHIHYSHDAWTIFPPKKAVALLREAGLKRAFVSSSSDEGTQKLYQEAPDLVVPVLRPYRRRGELSTWMHDETVLDLLKDRLEKYKYAGIGEFHAYGDDIETPVLQGVIALAKQYDLFLHAHGDADSIHRIFKHNPDARVLWAHSGFDTPSEVHEMLKTYPKLWADLALRSGHSDGDQVREEWRKLFEAFPDRLMLGTDTYTPERWPFVVSHAEWSREWLVSLPKPVAEGLAWKNAEALIENWKRK
ncbi:MAG: amidohydrolase family protein [Pseudomonadota bacterium]